MRAAYVPRYLRRVPASLRPRVALRDSRSRRTGNLSATIDTYSWGEWEPIDEEYYEDPEEDSDFADGVYGLDHTREDKTSQDVDVKESASELVE